MRRALVLAFCAGAVLSAGCGLFHPTDPEPPSGGVVQTNYTDPDATLSTIGRAVNDKGATNGVTAYLDAFSSPSLDGIDFDAIHLPSVVQALQGTVTIPDPWTHALESSFYARLIAIDNTAYAMTWAVDLRFSGEDVDNADSAVRNRIYTIQSESATVAKGYAKLTFQRSSSGRWVITLWEERDLEAGDDPDLTFSTLRLKP
jgi:hypothetical protein